MEVLLWVFIGILLLIIVCLSLKIYLMKKSAKEISSSFADKLMTDTNTLIDLSSRDRHMRKLAESINTELRQLYKERRHFQQGDHELKESVTNISHDLRTPLTAICGYLDLLEQEEKSEAVSRYLAIIRERTETLKQLTEELFRYSVIASTSGDLVFETVVLNHILEESISAYYAALKRRNITPCISIPEQKIQRYLNKNAVSRIFGNIISNVIKYSDGDLNITLSDDGEITFSNTASKLDDVLVGRLFDRFYTVENGQKSTGLGLSIAKILTEQMSGKISAEYCDGMIIIHVLFPDMESSCDR